MVDRAERGFGMFFPDALKVPTPLQRSEERKRTPRESSVVRLASKSCALSEWSF